jgi:hypothetical protein
MYVGSVETLKEQDYARCGNHNREKPVGEPGYFVAS